MCVAPDKYWVEGDIINIGRELLAEQPYTDRCKFRLLITRVPLVERNSRPERPALLQ